MGLTARIKSWFSGAEGSYRGPAVGWSTWGNPFPVSMGDGFQAGLTLSSPEREHVPVAYACVVATAKALSMCYPQHMVQGKDGKYEKSTTSPVSRVLRKPNSYQTWPQFLFNVVTEMLFRGEAFVQLVRDNRYAVIAMHLLPRGSCMPYVSPEDGSVFYSIGENPMNPQGIKYMAPARDIIHFRQYTPRHPLIGETALTAAALSLGVNVALNANQAAFFSQMSRPSGILSTDTMLTREQMQTLRTAFEEQSKGLSAGKIPILGGGLKFSAMGISSQDSQLVQAQRMSVEEVARVFGVPLPVIGDLTHGTMNNTETLINFWLSTGLGSLMENVERSFDAAFDLSATEYVELDVNALLRMDFKTRVEGLAKAVQGGILKPNEARASESLPPVDGGDTIYMQQQMVAIDQLEDLHKPPAPAPASAAPTEPANDDEEEADADVARALVTNMIARKKAMYEH
jgi:HK97 family phage portal protein